MKTFTLLENTFRRKLPSHFSSQEEIRMPEAEVEFFIQKYTHPGNSVLDIFAGFGTTLFVSEEMGRIPYGVEYDPIKWQYVKEHINESYVNNIVNGDSRQILQYNFPPIDFVFTSPPFTRKEDLDAPLTAYEAKGTYSDYLKGIRYIFYDLQKVVKPNGYIVVEVGNMKNRETQSVTTLAWDIGYEIAKSHHFLGEIIVGWSSDPLRNGEEGAYGYGYDHSYCLIFRNSLYS
ncbi:MAG: site-specific DNA-methyltransferase [Candidatus Lokiarchaeota archaeon]|nr:site-specific DNA-methyltransferase [Candidatus Lokiarchaeota archaeon]